MGKQFPSIYQALLNIGTVAPVGNVGIDMDKFSSGSVAKGERFIITASMKDATDVQAELLGTTGYDGTVQAIDGGTDGNQLTFALTGDSAAGVGVAVEVVDRKNMVVHFEAGVSTVGDVNTAIGDYNSDGYPNVAIIQVKAGSAGTVATVLAGGDAIVATNLAGGTLGVKTTDLIMYVRDRFTAHWGLYDDVWGKVTDGKLGAAKAEGCHQIIVRDLAAFDRIDFIKAGAGPASKVDVYVTEVLETSSKS